MIDNNKVRSMSNNKGVTITSLTIYVIVATVIVAVLAFLNANFFAKINDITDRSSIISESTKFKSAFIKDIKADGGVSVVEYSDNMIRLSNDTKYEIKVFKEDNGNKEYAVYRNKAIIAKNIVDGESGLEPYFGYDVKKNVVKIYLEFSDGKNNYTENGTYLVGRAISENVKKESVTARTMIVASPATIDTTDATKKITVTLALKDMSESDTINSFKYGWSREVGMEPESYQAVTLSGTGNKRTAEVGLNTRKGTSYLWAQAEINGQLITQCLGTYLLRSNTTLVYAGGETLETSPFLGSTAFVRNQIESVTLVNDLGNHKVTDSNCWDVSADGSETYLAWYELNPSTGLYKVTIGGDGGIIANYDSSYLFGNLVYTNEICNLKYLNTSLVNDMNHMFVKCLKLSEINICSFDMSKVTDISYMFISCENLNKIVMTNVDTSNVTNMSFLFCHCIKLNELYIDELNTENVRNMSAMFYECKKLNSLNLTHFNTNKVTDMSTMFCGCNEIVELDLSSFNTESVTNMANIFQGCSKIEKINLNNFNTINVTNMAAMFNACDKLKELNLNNFNTSRVINMGYMFNNCHNLETLNINSFDTSKVTNMQSMFYECQKLEVLDISSFDNKNVTNMNKIFYNCVRLNKVYIEKYDDLTEKGWNTASLTDCTGMFINCLDLVGGNGTAYDGNYTDATYAHIDEAGNPGYFTQK